MRDEERDSSDVEKQMPDVENAVFCSVSFNFKLCSYCQQSSIENVFLYIFDNIRVTVIKKRDVHGTLSSFDKKREP